MKKLLFILVLFMACGEDPKPVYTSIEGKWRFSAQNISGEFEIVNYYGKLTVDKGGFFVINGTRFEIDSKEEIYGLPGPIYFYLANLPNNVIAFREIEINKTYDQLTTNSNSYVISGKETIINEKIVITR